MRIMCVVCVVEGMVSSASMLFWRCVAPAQWLTAQRMRTPSIEKETW